MRTSVRVGPIRRGCGIVGPSGAGLGGSSMPTVPTVPAEITVDPVNDTAVEGLTASFSVTAIGTPEPTYKWQVNDGGGWVDATTGTGLTTANYTTSILSLGDDGNQYRCKVSNGQDDISDSATLTVEAGILAEVTVQPSNQGKYEGETATFSITAIGNPPPDYQWQVDTGGGFVNVSTGTGGTTNSYETAALVLGDDGNLYRCQVSNVGGIDTSTSATLTVTEATTQQPAAAFAGDAQGASGAMGATFGQTGLLSFTLAGWFYFEPIVSGNALGKLLTAEGQANRSAGLQIDNVFSNWNLTIGDSNTGVTNDVWGADSPPAGQWIFMTFRGPDTWPGTFTATWQAEAGGTIYTAPVPTAWRIR